MRRLRARFAEEERRDVAAVDLSRNSGASKLASVGSRSIMVAKSLVTACRDFPGQRTIQGRARPLRTSSASLRAAAARPACSP